MNQTTSFFKDVARHNLERFHSECLAWLFNNEHEIANQVIRMLLTKFEGYDPLVEVKFKYAFTEVQQLDLVLYFRTHGVNKAVIIENKIKSSEGSKVLSAQEEIAWNSEFKAGHIFSQTEYYHLRPSARKNFREEGMNLTLDSTLEGIMIYDTKIFSTTKSQEIKLLKGYENWILIQKENCFPIFLIPAKWEERIKNQDYLKDINLEQYNTWREAGLDKNPWKTASYRELVDTCQSAEKTSIEENQILVNSYLSHLNHMSLNYHTAMNAQFEAYAPSKFGAYEYFKLLAAAMKTKMQGENPNLFVNITPRPGSSKSGDPILDICLKEGIKLKFTKANLDPNTLFNIGIQVQGEKVKIFIAAAEYEEVEIKDKEDKNKYAIEFFQLLKGTNKDGDSHGLIIGDRKNCQVVFNSKSYQLKESLSKGKSFMDYYFTLGQNLYEKNSSKESSITYQEFFNLLYSLSEAVSKTLEEK
jgi:hypothetical protein